MKGLLYEEYLLNPAKVRSTYFLDPVLANAKGHELLADTVIAYLESEICSVWDAGALETDMAILAGKAPPASPLHIGEDYPSLLSGKGLRKGVGENGEPLSDDDKLKKAQSKNRQNAMRVPPFRIIDKPHEIAHFREIKPACASANDLINPLPSSVFAGSGWNPVQPKVDEEDERHYWFTDIPGSVLKIPIKVGAGEVAVYYQKGAEGEGWGNVLCWVDDNTEGAVELKGSWDRHYGQPMSVVRLLLRNQSDVCLMVAESVESIKA